MSGALHVGSDDPEIIWLRSAHSRFTPNYGLTKYHAGTVLSCT
jgi:hypothetical protein